MRRDIIAVYSENHAKFINTLQEKCRVIVDVGEIYSLPLDFKRLQ
jgi:hypothetical protein